MLAFTEKTRSNAQKAALLERRNALLHQIRKWRELQAVYMPGVSDATETGPSPREKAESIKLWLPSHLEVAERDSLCSGGVVTSEREFRFGQVHDSLDELRKARRIRRGLIVFHKVQLAGEGQKTQTQSRAVMHTIQERIDRAVRRYRTARAALLRLDPSGNWQEFYHALSDRDNRGPGKEPEEVPTSDGQYFPSWIWLTNSSVTTGDATQSTISPDEVNEDMRVEWAQCVARADRWEEEVTLLQEEMRRVVCFLEWKSKDWISKAGVRASVVTPEIRSGLSAYAHKQGSIFHNLAIRFCQRWDSTLISLSLPHAWATEFLESQHTLLIDPDLGRREFEGQEHESSKSPAAPHPTESSTTNAAAIPPTPTGPEASTESAETSNDNPKTGYNTSNDDEDSNNSNNSNNNNDNDDDNGDDDNDEPTDDSDVDSSESEYEPGGW